MMMKTVVIAYLAAQGVIYSAIIVLQGATGDAVNLVTEVNDTVGLLHIIHPLLGMLGQFIYAGMVYYRTLERKERGEDINPWNSNQSQMLLIRIGLSMVFSTIASMVLIKLGSQQSIINIPEGLGELGIYIADMLIGYFVIKTTKIEFENKVAEKIKDRMKL